MTPTNQPATGILARRRIAQAQAPNQLRPENELDTTTTGTSQQPPTNSDYGQFKKGLQRVLRRIVDLIFELRDQFTPLGLFTQGDPNGDPILVPASTGTSDLGTPIGLQVQFTRPGLWLLGCSVALHSISDTGEQFSLFLSVASSPQSLIGIAVPAGDGTTSLAQGWQVVSLTGQETAALTIKKAAAAAGTSTVLPASSTLWATWQGASS